MTSSISDIYSSYYTQNSASSSKTSALESKLNSGTLTEATDGELLEACQEFEAYLIEQVMKQVKESISTDEEEENEYLSYFGDMMVQEYAEILTEQGDLGIAQTLYESMKNNMNAVNIKTAESVTATTEAATKNTETEEAEQEAIGAAESITM